MCAWHGRTGAPTAEACARTSKAIENDREEVDPPRWGGSARPGLEPGPRRLTCSTARTYSRHVQVRERALAYGDPENSSEGHFGILHFFSAPACACSNQQTGGIRTHTHHDDGQDTTRGSSRADSNRPSGSTDCAQARQRMQAHTPLSERKREEEAVHRVRPIVRIELCRNLESRQQTATTAEWKISIVNFKKKEAGSRASTVAMKTGSARAASTSRVTAYVTTPEGKRTVFENGRRPSWM